MRHDILCRYQAARRRGRRRSRHVRRVRRLLPAGQARQPMRKVTAKPSGSHVDFCYFVGQSQSLNDAWALRSHQSYRRKLHPLLRGEVRQLVVHGYAFSARFSTAPSLIGPRSSLDLPGRLSYMKIQ